MILAGLVGFAVVCIGVVAVIIRYTWEKNQYEKTHRELDDLMWTHQQVLKQAEEKAIENANTIDKDALLRALNSK